MVPECVVDDGNFVGCIVGTFGQIEGPLSHADVGSIVGCKVGIYCLSEGAFFCFCFNLFMKEGDRRMI